MTFIQKMLLISLVVTLGFSQSHLLIRSGIGNGTSTVSNYFIEIEEGVFSASIKVDRMKSGVRDFQFEFAEQDYYTEIFQSMGKLASLSANGIHINIKERREGLSVDVGKISVSVDNWKFNGDADGPRVMPSLNWDIIIQNAQFTPTGELTRNMDQDLWELFNYFSNGTNTVSLNKVTASMSISNNGKVTGKGILSLPIGKLSATLDATMNREPRLEPFINLLEMKLSNLSPELTTFLDNLILNDDVPIRKKGNGYILLMTGSVGNPRFR